MTRAHGMISLVCFTVALGAGAAAGADATRRFVKPVESTTQRGLVEGAPGTGEPTLEEVRRATERFRDVDVALAEGYIRDPFDLCETAEMMGRPASLIPTASSRPSTPP